MASVVITDQGIFNDIQFTPRVIQMEDLNYNVDVRNTVIRAYKKRAKKWLFGESYHPILTFFNLSNDKKYRLVKDQNDVISNKDKKYDESAIKEIKERLFKYYLTDEFIARVLDDFRIKKNVNWYDLAEYKSKVKAYLLKKIVKRLENEVKRYQTK